MELNPSSDTAAAAREALQQLERTSAAARGAR
jgi:hypothetical protein